MEGIASESPFARMVGESLTDHNFTLLDVGCSSGIDPVWGVFGKSLRAFGFDPNIDEIERLAASETPTGVCYVPGFVGVSPESPYADRMRDQKFWARSPWARLSVASTLEKREAIAALSSREATELNLWHRVRLANADEPIILPSFCAEQGVRDVDFIKIDVDGADFLILRSLESSLHDLRVLGVGIEVNFFGSDDPDIHTLHNVDRFMRKTGFDLFFLSSRPYSAAALPARYQYASPSVTEFGRPLQGDAIYLRDAASPENAEWCAAQSPAKLLKLAALYSLAGLPDCAAEILVVFRERLSPIFDVEAALDLLTQAVRADDMPARYQDYMAAFEADDPCFYTTQPSAKAPAPDPAVLVENLQLREELRAIRASTCWRATAPLRRAIDTIRQIGRRR